MDNLNTERFGNFDCLVKARIFREEHNIIKRIIKNKKDIYGEKKYNSESHFLRCAIINLIKKEV